MPDENDKIVDVQLVPGPGVSAWLSRIFDTLQPSQTQMQPYLPDGLSGSFLAARRIDFNVPEDFISSDGGTLQRLEIRGLPKGVRLSSGSNSDEGFWLFEPAELTGLKFIVPDEIALPFSIFLKAVFANTESDQTWVELTGYEVADGVIPEATTTTAEPQVPDTLNPTPMVVIDLDVSVGTDDPAVLQGIAVQFSGLPEGASLNTGSHDGNGVWMVPALDLPELSIVIPADTADFDLNVVMFIDGSEPQSATIQVNNDVIEANPQSAYIIRLAPNDGAHPIRFSVFSDGTATYDRIIQWPDGPDRLVDIRVPYLEDALPFEIVMRHQPFEKGEGGSPRLIGVTIEGDFIAPDSFAISANSTLDEVGMGWHGDLVIDVRRALKSISTATDSEPDTPAAGDSASVTAQSDAETGTIPELSETTPTDAETMPVDEQADTDAAMPEVLEQHPVEPDILFMDASFEDLQSSQFIGELKRLRDFIRTRPSSNDGEVYARLGIDVTKWRDMRVLGPVGADVDLDPLLPALAPRGGFDNTRFVAPIRLRDLPADDHVLVRLSRLAPGTLLTHGINSGNGTWLLTVSEAADVSVLPPLGMDKTTAAHVAWLSGPDNATVSTRASLLIGVKHTIRPHAATEMRSLSLPLEPIHFDPEGHNALSITIGDLPPGTLLSGGRNHGGGVWTLETTSGAPLTLTSATDSKPFSITVTCVALNSENGNSTVVSRGLEIAPAQGKIRLKNNLAA